MSSYICPCAKRSHGLVNQMLTIKQERLHLGVDVNLKSISTVLTTSDPTFNMPDSTKKKSRKDEESDWNPNPNVFTELLATHKFRKFHIISLLNPRLTTRYITSSAELPSPNHSILNCTKERTKLDLLLV